MNILEKLRQKPLLAQVRERMLSGQTAIQLPSAPSSSNGHSLFRTPPKTDLKKFLDDAKVKKNPHGYAEIMRICKLPIVFDLCPEELEEYSRLHVLAAAYNAGFRLKLAQAAAFMAYERIGGCFGMIGAGDGKSLIAVGIASRAYEKGLRKGILHVPAGVFQQMMTRSIPWCRTKIPVRVPFIGLGNESRAKRLQIARSKRPGCYVMPYSCLSTEDTNELLEAIEAEYYITDEGHNLASRRAARTRRLLEFLIPDPRLGKKKPELVSMSGTFSNKSIMEYHHILTACLGAQSPVPISPTMAADWSAYVDSKAQQEYTGSNAGPLTQVHNWAKLHFPEKEIPNDVSGFRAAYRLRLTTSPGVVATAGQGIGTSLIIANRPIKVNAESEQWKNLTDLMDQVVDKGIAPNGDQIEHAIHSFRWLYELTAGFYNELVWPTAEEYAKRKKISQDDAAEQLEKAQQHHDLNQIYAKILRKWFQQHSKPGIDTPMLVGANMARREHRDVGHELYAAWKDMKALEWEGMPTRDSNAVRICDYKVQAAAKWAINLTKKFPGEGAIIWAYNQEMVDWTFEALVKAGVDPIKCPAGSKFNEIMINTKNKDRFLVASITAHGEGKELQHFQHQFYVQWPRSARRAEQVLARLHRTGQEADELVAYLCNTTMFDDMVYAACLNDALYIQQTKGNLQRVIYAGYDPLPIIFPPEVLRERGFENQLLSSEHQKVMQELFGTTQT